MERVPLARWSELLLREIFADEAGEARPVTTIVVDDELLTRTLRRGGIEAEPMKARRLFLAAFPGRDYLQAWCSGALDPGYALVAFLVLCCFAASEAADSELHDYRKRLREIMRWSEPVSDCSGLPALWRRLEVITRRGAEKADLRPLVLPDPRHRTQIGHAIELTFPSHGDTRKLQTELQGASWLDLDEPAAILRWLAPFVARARFSHSFKATFEDFRDEWSRGQRALLDHRFWSGWRVVAASARQRDETSPFAIICDEWGEYMLVDKQAEAVFALTSSSNADRLPLAVRLALRDAKPIFLAEAEWARWEWCGSGVVAIRGAKAALVCRRSFSPTRLELLDPVDVKGAPGWAFTSAVDLLLASSERNSGGENRLLDLSISGPPRVDAARLCRPSFPVRLKAWGPAGRLAILGSAADRLELTKTSADEWLARPREPFDGEVQVCVLPSIGTGEVRRTLRLTKTVVAPKLGDPVSDRYLPDERPVPTWWDPTEPTVADGDTRSWGAAPGARGARPEILDVVEYFAARPGVVPLGSVVEMLSDVLPEREVDPWFVLRGLFEASVIRPLRVRGWRGRAVIAGPPRGVLLGEDEGTHRLRIEGLLNEALRDRIAALASAHGVAMDVRGGVSAWAVETVTLASADREAIARLAADADLPVKRLRRDLRDLTPFARVEPTEVGTGHTDRYEIRLRLADGGVASIWSCETSRTDTPRLWATGEGAPQRFWSERHIAVLDALRVAGAAAFLGANDRTLVVQPGACLPLAVARWARLATGVASGPTGPSEFAYGNTPYVSECLRSYLGSLYAQPAEAAEIVHAPGRRLLRSGRAMAIASSTRTLVVDVLDKARSQVISHQGR